MPQHLIEYFGDPVSPKRKKLGHTFCNSLEEALARVNAQLPQYRASHKNAGYRIEDAAGRIVKIGRINSLSR